MQYMGGKARTAKYIAPFINEAIRKIGPNALYIEPFVGGCNVLPHILAPLRYALDINPWLIVMYQALQAGWIPPSEVTEETWRRYKTHKPLDDPMTAFCGFGCSFGGKWFGGYARFSEKRWSKSVSRGSGQSVLKKMITCANAIFQQASFFDLPLDCPDCIIYCDPPYESVTAYAATGTWDPARFWCHAEAMAQSGAIVFVSEYAEKPYAKVWQNDNPTVISGGKNNEHRTKRREYLYRLGCD